MVFPHLWMSFFSPTCFLSLVIENCPTWNYCGHFGPYHNRVYSKGVFPTLNNHAVNEVITFCTGRMVLNEDVMISGHIHWALIVTILNL